MKISIILDNYNYADYLPQAIESVLAQTHGDFELIVVDDGSSDNSPQIINEYASKESRIKPIFKSNGGQASAFNAGFEASSGEVVCFLDSDDYFAFNKLEKIALLHEDGFEYIYTDHQSVDTKNEPCLDNIKRYKYDGHNLFLVHYMSKYPGNVTSTISLKRSLATRIFPLIHEQEWRIQADDAIVFQASMLGRSKHMDDKLTHYRIHEQNGYYGKKRSSDYTYELLKKRSRLKDIALAKMDISHTFLSNGYNLLAEFNTHRFVDANLLKLYLKVLWFEMDLPILKRLEISIDICRSYQKRKNG